jgi:two-component system response regulator RpaA
LSTNMKQAFSTGEVAKLLHVSPGTVSRWFDRGKLKGYFIVGSRSRRIPRASLISFCREHGLPLGELENEQETKEEDQADAV